MLLTVRKIYFFLVKDWRDLPLGGAVFNIQKALLWISYGLF
jgi:hypothetical protein